jgi:hypothetical protein
VLTNYFSQTFRPGHHNFVDDYIFEPRLDPNVTGQQLSELSGRNIKLLYLHDAPIATNRTVWALGFDDSVRQLR